MSIYAVVVIACWVVFFGIWTLLAMSGGRGGERRSSPAAIVVRLLMIAAIVLAVRYRFPPAMDFGRFAPGAGAVLCIGGLAFAAWARVALGRSWGMPMTLREKPELVTHGPYAYVRHPIYTGMAFMAIGTTLVYSFLLLWAAILIGYVLLSARREERDLEQLFPDTFPEYRRRSKMLVPFVL
jgi:protein-S-isoprenylcysteine O-methyltransferase Ste14